MNIPLAVPNLAGREREYLLECVDSTFVSTAGPFVNEFAKRIAVVSGSGSASVTSSGTVALQMALEALGVGHGDLVIAPSLTFIATANAISHCNAAPWLFDVCDDWTIDLELVASTLERTTEPDPRGRRHVVTGQVVSAIVPVMTMGVSMDLDAVARLASSYGLRVVVDAAAAIGATDYQQRPLAASGVDAVCFSFNGNKTITSGGGGAVAAADDEVVQRIDHLISTGRTGTDYDHDVVGYNFRITNLEAAVGLAQLEQLETFLRRKAEVASAYGQLADAFCALEAFPTPPAGRSVHWLSGLFYVGSDLDLVEAFVGYMRGLEIDVRPFWKPVHLQRPYEQALRTSMTATEDVWQRVIPLPCSTGITDDELQFVVESASGFWAAHE